MPPYLGLGIVGHPVHMLYMHNTEAPQVHARMVFGMPPYAALLRVRHCWSSLAPDLANTDGCL